MFFAGLYFRRNLMPNILRHINDWTSLGAAVHALQSSSEGTFPPVQSLLAMVGYTLVFSIAAIKQFK